MKHVLVVDDEQIQLRGTSLGLRVEGFTVEVATGAGEALATLDSKPIDVVLVDLMMPRISGLELARLIRSRFPQVRVVLTSAYHLSRRQIDRLGLGDVGFIAKPCPIPELANKLRALMESSADSGVVTAVAPAPPPGTWASTTPTERR